jgi:TonB-linked SusC/RagA family outer membrane protein
MQMREKRLTIIISLLFITISNTLLAQSSAKIDLKLENATLKDFFTTIEKKTEYTFMYNNLDLSQKVSINVKQTTLDNVLKEVLTPKEIFYEIVKNHIILKNTPFSSIQTIRGKVIDQHGEPLIGASVTVAGSDRGGTTDILGKYNVEAYLNETLKFSYIGFKKEERRVTSDSLTDVVLHELSSELEEVVVVGYGTQKRGNLTSSIASIKGKEITTTTHSSLAQSIQGKIPGLQIRQQSGEPGEFNTNINIRGFGQPLYVIDGIVRDGGSEFQRLNPNDIESISVLKDASAAIYGLGAANGVILVTTKKGISGRPKFTYNGTTGWQTPTDIPDMMNAPQFLEMMNDANINAGGNPSITKEELQKWQQGVLGYESTDWYGEIMKSSAMQMQHDFSVRGGNDAVDYFISLGYFGESGLLKSDDLKYDRYTFRSNVSAKLNKHLSLDIMLSGRYDERIYPGDNFFWIFRATRVSLPTERPYANNNPKYPTKVSVESNNPVAMAQKDMVGYGEVKNKYFQSMATLTYNAPFLPGLQLKGTLSYDSNDQFNKNLIKTYNIYEYFPTTDTYAGSKKNNPSRISNASNDYNRKVIQGQVSYNKTFASSHTVGATYVYEQRQSFSRYSYLSREYDFFTNDQINQASVNNQQTDGNEDEQANISHLGRFTYNYSGKYLLEFAFRYDGSYRYAPGKRFVFFPVVSGGWRISEENFMRNNLKFLNNLKLRASYGTIGENLAAPFQYVLGYSTVGGGMYEFTDGSFTMGAASPGIINRNLTWSKSNILDFGIEIGIFKELLNVEFDVYRRDRSGLLARRSLSLPNTFGGDLPQENLNSDRVEGLDFVISHQSTIQNLRYGIGINFNYARTMLRYVERSKFRSSWDQWKNGTSDRWQDILWGYDMIGQYSSMEEIIHAPLTEGNLGNTRVLPGDFIYLDANGDGVIDANDQLPLFWGGQPKLHYGITFNLGWKGFDLNALLQGSGKYSVRFREVYSEFLAFKGNSPEFFTDRWRLSDPYDPNSEWIQGKWPAARFSENMANVYRESQVWRRDASYLRIKSVELGYTLPSNLTKRYWLERVRIFANAHNIFTFADSFVKPFDPEKIEGTANAGLNYPLTKSFNFGLNVTF